MVNGAVVFGDDIEILIHWLSGGNGGSLMSTMCLIKDSPREEGTSPGYQPQQVAVEVGEAVSAQ